MKIVVAPDKFKGSLPAIEVAAAIAAGLRSELPAAELVTIPVADGGDGTVDAAVAAGFERVPVTVDGPTGEPVRASYARRGAVAVVELAVACGLARLPGGRREPLTASSFGAGQALATALGTRERETGTRETGAPETGAPETGAPETGAPEAGARRIIFGVGGSASTDGGAGLLQALGARVLDTRGEPLARGGAALRDVAALDLAGLHPALRTASVILATDVANPLTGPDGAAEVYGPQKGASPDQVRELASGLRRWAALVTEATGTDWSHARGAGAAGGVGFAALAVLGAEPHQGIGLMLDLVGFGAALDGADLVITGEGSLDTQTLAGKAPMGVARAAARRGIPVVAVAGRSTLTDGELARAGIAAVYTLSDLEPDPVRSTAEASLLLRQVGQTLAHDQLVRAVTGR
jgi:glycerate kinase